MKQNASPPVPELVPELLDRAALRAPTARAVTDATGTWTYAQLAAHSIAISAWLHGSGVRHGDRVLVRLGNVRGFVALLYGATRIGAIVVPINPGMKLYQLRQIVEDCTPTLIVVAADDPVATEPDLAHLIRPWQRIEAEAHGWATPATPALDGGDLGLLIYTSGTTAKPKAVMSPHRAITFATRAIAQRLRYRADDVVLAAVPLSFDYGLYQIFLATLAGAELVVTNEAAHVRLFTTIRTNGVTVVPVVPSLAHMLVTLAVRDGGPTAVRLFTNTGAALLPATIADLRRAFPGAQVCPMYGITECKRVVDPGARR